MGVRKILKKCGIKEIEKLDFEKRETISKKIATIIFNTFKEYEIEYSDIYLKLVNTDMYLADIDSKSDRVNYIYKNQSIYIDRKLNLGEISPELLRGFMYRIQEKRDKKSNITKLGLCTFNNSKTQGLSLNEAAIQYSIYKILNLDKVQVNAYGIKAEAVSQIYPLLTNILLQMILITGEKALIKTLFTDSKDFKSDFSKKCGRGIYDNVVKQADVIYKKNNDIINIDRKILFKSKIKEKNKNKLRSKVVELSSSIRSTYMNAQKVIYIAYISRLVSKSNTVLDLEVAKSKIGEYKKSIGISQDVSENTFSGYILDQYYKIETKIEEIQNKALTISKSSKGVKTLKTMKKLSDNNKATYNENKD